ncbi:hypothetical protein SCLCIDRAFT_250229 [Scleroderma citrinum Foug A]|uniref:Uncharacterized protein n=1 Tax=Scleroderma citrinum Foug A TaxID=1036808 RepID=A0A0C2Z2Y5_9AGAM|nr:hypothetical protein SCLCIDRAFT_250229 [Scleroderma citrinum Foug A]
MTQLPEGKQWVKTAAVRSCNEVKVADVSCDGCDDEDLLAPVEVGTLQAVELEESTWSLHLCDYYIGHLQRQRRTTVIYQAVSVDICQTSEGHSSKAAELILYTSPPITSYHCPHPMQNLVTPLSQELVRSGAHTDHKGHDVALLLEGVGSAFYVVPLPVRSPNSLSRIQSAYRLGFSNK